MGTGSPTSPDLADAVLIGESLTRPQAFAAIFDRHFDGVHAGLALRMGSDRADEVAAAAFTLAFERRATFRGGADARAWLVGIASDLTGDRGQDPRPSAGAPSVTARLDARRRLLAAIEDEPAGLHSRAARREGPRRSAAGPSPEPRRPRVGRPVLALLIAIGAVAVAVAVVLGALALVR